MTVTASGVTRFRRSHPCPICGGGDDMPRGRGERCSGYLSSDGRFAYCTREEHAGQAQLEHTDPPSYRHILEGECRCGTTHAHARPADDLVATYDYLDSDGTLLYQVVRLAGKQFRQRRPDGHGDWIWNMQGIHRVLYRLPAVLEAAAAGATVYVVEGEKDVHAIEKAGHVATTSPGGAGKWRSEYATALTGARVVIVADNDQPGLAHAHQVAQTLPAATTTITRPATGKDAHDHLAAGKTLQELLPLEQAAAESSTTVFETLRAFLKRDLPKSESLIGVHRNGTNLLPRYGWVMPWGREGCGKTSILVDLLFHAAEGRKWLHYPIARELRIVAIINEGIPGGLQDKLQQKTEVWDGNTDKVLDNISIYVSPWGEFKFSDPEAAQHARKYALDFKADYVVADPLHTLGTTGAGTPQETEEFKTLLRAFGVWNDIGVITAHHSNKNGMISGDWARHPDTVIRLEKDGKSPATKFVLEKARPADPDELGVPQLLEWVTDTIGYRYVPIDTNEKVSDDELKQRIHAALQEADSPLTLTDLQAAVIGDNKRIAAIAKASVKAGEITNHSERADRYLLTNGTTKPNLSGVESDSQQALLDPQNHPVPAPTPGTPEDTRTAPQSSMNTEIPPGARPTPGSTDNTIARQSGGSSGVPLSPLKRGTDTGRDDSTPTEQATEPDEDEIERLARLLTPDADDIDWSA